MCHKETAAKLVRFLELLGRMVMQRANGSQYEMDEAICEVDLTSNLVLVSKCN
jgi:hypothetical protein